MNSDPPTKKRVEFGSIELKEYTITLGDHPLSFDGPPVTISWTSEFSEVFTIDDYEENRGERRGRHDLRLSGDIRAKLARDNGHSWEEIDHAIIEAEEVRRRRFNSISRMQWDFLASATESAGRKIKNVKKGSLKRVVQIASLASPSSKNVTSGGSFRIARSA